MEQTNPEHVHTYDAQGHMTCCSQEQKIYTRADAKALIATDATHSDDDGHDHDHSHDEAAGWRTYLPAGLSFVMLLTGIVADNFPQLEFFDGYLRLAWYVVAYLPVGIPVIREAGKALLQKEFFTEFTLMTIATLGAFAIGEYPEGVAVMLFYAVGELFQSAAVKRAKGNIRALLDVRPKQATRVRDTGEETVDPQQVEIGETIRVKAGEKVPLDGELIGPGSSFDTSALTGESNPRSIAPGEPVLAGMLNVGKVIELRVTKKFADSSIARILDMVQNATARKAKTELLIRKFARIYTPIVFGLAVAVTFVPYLFVSEYVFTEWLYRALVFLVISCPCALVISIPLGYFGGIGAASRNGILFKGSNFLDLMTKVNTVVMDKTGTLTKGVFKVRDIYSVEPDQAEFLRLLASLENRSTHPIAKAIVAHTVGITPYPVTEAEEIAGHGLKGFIHGKTVLAGNAKLLKKSNIPYNPAIDAIEESIVVVAIDNRYAGYVTVADEVKEDAAEAVRGLHKNGIKRVVMLSGDKTGITRNVARQVGIDEAFGDLLPENKVEKMEAMNREPGLVTAFVGDGINDAPALALSDVGMAMGGLGSDAAIETADVVIQTDQPSKIVTAIQIAKATKRVVIQNISLAFVVKVIVLILGAGGIATMWEAVFADVGVALLAILNAVRIQKKTF